MEPIDENKTNDINKEIDKLSKPYIQFSKKLVAFLLCNLIVIELFTMIMCIWLRDLSVIPYLITSIGATMISGIIWYLKNSESEKKARINAEIEKMKLDSRIGDIETEPDTFYKESEHLDEENEQGDITFMG